MKIRILRRAMGHLSHGARFYEQQAMGLGTYFRNSLIQDIERLKVTAGVHEVGPEAFTELSLVVSPLRFTISSNTRTS